VKRYFLPFLSASLLALFQPPERLLASPHNILLARGRTEPVVAVDPRSPSTIVAGSNTDYNTPVGGAYPTAYFVSRNAGTSFSFGSVPLRQPYTTGADPSVAIARNGAMFFSYLGETTNFCSGGKSAVLLARSQDRGRSFAPPTAIDTNPNDDKPYVAEENTGRGPHLFVVWDRGHGKHGSDIWFARSTDGGSRFGSPQRLFYSNTNNFAPFPLVGPKGHVYVFWSTFPDSAASSPARTRIMMRASTDDGKHFQTARQAIGPYWNMPEMAQPGSMRNSPMPMAAVDAAGNLYLVWAQATRNQGGGRVDDNIMVSQSRNSGASWSSPRRVNDSTRGDRFMPAVSALGDGSIGVAFYDRRRSLSGLDVYATRVSFSGGFSSSRNLRVSQGNSPVSDILYLSPGSTCFLPGRFFGDYIGSAACANSTLCVVWADTQLHVYNETDVWFARAQLASLPNRFTASRLRLLADSVSILDGLIP
jgi:hypothetical protein